MGVQISYEPPVPNRGESITVVGKSQEGLTNIKLKVYQPSGAILGRSDVAVGQDGNWHTWTWETDLIQEFGIHKLLVTSDTDGGEADFYVPRGQPRSQYQRAYVLLPPSAGVEWVLELIENGGWEQARYTIGGSADDAGIGDLDVRRVIAINPNEWGDLQEFYASYYPGVEYGWIEATLETVGDEIKTALGLTWNWADYLLWQRDPEWADEHHGSDACTTTIGDDGCWDTCSAMLMRIWDIHPYATPLTVQNILYPDGYTGCRTWWWAMEERLGLKVTAKIYDDAGAITHLESGGACFAEVLPSTVEHFVLIVAHEEGRFLMLDPWADEVAWLDERYEGTESWRLLEPVEDSPEPEPEPGPDTSLPHIYGVHEDHGNEAAVLMRDNGIQGYIVFTEGLEADPENYSGRDYHPIATDYGHTPIARLNYGYGSWGTVPPESLYENFRKRVLNYVANSQGCNIWIIGNEPNNPREWPDGVPITPEAYANLFNQIQEGIRAIDETAIVMPAAIDGYNAEIGYGSPEYMRRMWGAIGWAKAICMHAYTHGPDPALITADTKFGDPPMVGIYYDFRNFIDLLGVMPSWTYDLPIYLTETNHFWHEIHPDPPHPTYGWLNQRTGWIQAAYSYTNGWNSAGGGQQIRCLALYRWPDIDPWVIHGKDQVIADFVETMQYKWRPYKA